MKKLILKGRVAKTYKGIFTQLNKALHKLYTEEEIDNLGFYLDIDNDENFYIWDYTEDNDERTCTRYHLIYERVIGMVYLEKIGIEPR